MAGNEKIRSSAAIVLLQRVYEWEGGRKRRKIKNKSIARSSDEPELVH